MLETQTAKFAEVLAKIGAKRGTLLSDGRIRSFAESKTLDQLVLQLRGTVYQTKLAKISLPYNSRKLERAFRENLIEDFVKIVKSSPRIVAPYLQAYLQRFDVENLKVLIRGVHAELGYEEKLSRLYFQVQDFFKNRNVFEEACKTTDLRQLVNALRKTEYAPSLNLGLSRYEQTGSTMFFDVLLDKIYYGKVYEAYQGLPRREKAHSIFYASMENDSFTILTLLRGKVLNYEPSWLRTVVPRENFYLPKEQVESLVASDDYESALAIVGESHYGNLFEKSATPEETVAKAERSFRKSLLDHAVKNSVVEIFNIGAPLAYMTQKEVETGNLVAVSLGVEASMRPEEIQNGLLLLG